QARFFGVPLRAGSHRVRLGGMCIHAGAPGGVGGGPGGGSGGSLAALAGRGFRGLGGLAGGARILGGWSASIQHSERSGRPSEAGAASISATISASRSRNSSCARYPAASGTSFSSQPN